MVVAIKIGENEPEQYIRASVLTKHGDIIHVFPDDIITFGQKGDKQFLAVRIDTSTIPAKKVEEAMLRMSEQWVENQGMVRCNVCSTEFRLDVGVCPGCQAEDFEGIEQLISKRLYTIDLDTVPVLPLAKRQALSQAGDVKRSIKPAIYQYVADYEQQYGKKPPREEVAAYQEQLLEAFDISSLQDFSLAVPFKTMIKYIVNKKTSETLEEELK